MSTPITAALTTGKFTYKLPGVKRLDSTYWLPKNLLPIQAK